MEHEHRIESLIDHALLTRLADEARQSPRLRKNHNFHGSDDDSCHRLLNAIEPASYIPPHRHLDPSKDETIIALTGAFGVVLFDETGRVTRTHRLEAGGPVCGLTVPHGVFHTFVACASGSVMFESKAGPYRPLSTEERAPWAPAEGADGAEVYAAGLRRLFGLAEAG